MSKHRRNKEYTGSYDNFNGYTGYNDANAYNGYDNNSVINKLSSILGNIDINQITSLLNAIGTLNKSDASNDADLKKGKTDNGDPYNSDINLFELVSQAKAVNDMIMNDNAEVYQDKEASYSDKNYEENLEEVNVDERNKHGKKKSRKNRDNKKEQNDTINEDRQDGIKYVKSDDPIINLLNAMQPLIVPDKAEIIDKIAKLYMEGKI